MFFRVFSSLIYLKEDRFSCSLAAAFFFIICSRLSALTADVDPPELCLLLLLLLLELLLDELDLELDFTGSALVGKFLNMSTPSFMPPGFTAGSDDLFLLEVFSE